MNILFLLKYYKVGGVETVTHALANKFQENGHKCIIYCLSDNGCDNEIYPYLNAAIKVVFSDNKNVENLRTVLVNNHIDVVINQSGHLKESIFILRKASKKLDIKVISVYHNMPGVRSDNRKESIIKRFKKTLQRIKAIYQMRYVYEGSQHYVLLSPSFVEIFKSYTHLHSVRKLKVIPNPLTIYSTNCHDQYEIKNKELIYVGRLDYNQKRVHRIIDIWSIIESKFPEWKLTIVGDGPEKSVVEKQVKLLGMKNVSFEGFKNPEPYYERATILLLTSEYEGFPLVIAEAMSFGVVPVVYGSYSAVYDIIEDEKNGFIIPYSSVFNTSKMADKLMNLMSSEALLKKVSREARKNSIRYSSDIIYGQWMDLCNS